MTQPPLFLPEYLEPPKAGLDRGQLDDPRIDGDRYDFWAALREWAPESQDKRVRWWAMFRACFGNGTVRQDAWSGDYYLGTRVVSVEWLVCRFEDCTQMFCPFQPPDFRRKFSDLVAPYAFSPGLEYLNSLAPSGPWEYWDTLSQRLFGASDSLAQTYLSKFLISAVARVVQPGCQVDTMLILQGRQGVQKTRFFQELFGRPFFKTLHEVTKDADRLRLMGRSWCLEMGELAHLKGRDVEALKADLTETEDAYRKLYAESITLVPRHCVYVGTTNESYFLKDATGSRRFWVIEVQVPKIDRLWVRRHRDAIWTEALRRYESGEQWYLSDEEQLASESANEAYTVDEPLADILGPRLALLTHQGPVAITTAVIITGLLQVAPSNLKSQEYQVCKVMPRLGWVKSRRRIGGTNTHYWHPKDTEPTEAVSLSEALRVSTMG